MNLERQNNRKKGYQKFVSKARFGAKKRRAITSRLPLEHRQRESLDQLANPITRKSEREMRRKNPGEPKAFPLLGIS